MELVESLELGHRIWTDQRRPPWISSTDQGRKPRLTCLRLLKVMNLEQNKALEFGTTKGRTQQFRRF